MNILDVLNTVRCGAKVQREGWGRAFLIKDNLLGSRGLDGDSPVKVMYVDEDGFMEVWKPNYIDMYAEDWKVYG